MPAHRTLLRSATPAQRRYLQTLIGERTAESMGDALTAEVERAMNGLEVRTDLIDRVMATPRATRRVTLPGTTVTVDAPARQGEVIPAPTMSHRAGRMLHAGGIEATVSNPDGTHTTIRIRTQARSGRGYANAAPTDEGARTNITVLGSRIGWINVVDGEWRITLRTRRDVTVNAVHALINYCAGIPTDLVVREASRCGRCMRQLTDPVSIERGIGPECFGRDTGSRHAAVGSVDVRIQADPTPARSAIARVAEQIQQLGASAGRASEVMTQVSPLIDVELTTEPISEPVLTRTGRETVEARNIERARDMIAEALDSYFGESECDFAMSIFNQLARS